MNKLEVAAMQELNSSYAIIVDGELSYQRQAMLNMFRKGAQWQAEQSPWISVEEQLPDNDDDLYIVLDTKLKPHGCGVCEFNLDINKWVGVSGIIVNPTHWMPIPNIE